MKANRKFTQGDDEAVSPVIAVILMVAITVVLAATVYVWVSGFGSNSSQPAKSIAFTSDGAISGAVNKTYLVASASPGLKWTDLTFKLEGTSMTYADLWVAPVADNTYCVLNNAGTACESSAANAALVDAGDRVRFHDTAISGEKLICLDSASNSIILTVTIQ